MNRHTFASISHLAAAITRRTTLQSLGGAALAAIIVGTNPSASAARKKKSSDTCKKKAKQRCSADAAACRATVLANCGDDPSPATCAARLNPCCDTCSANGFIACLAALLLA